MATKNEIPARTVAFVIASMALVACTADGVEPGAPLAPDAPASPGPASLPSTVPLVGFAPLPADTIDPKGSADYDSLFADGAPWPQAMSKISYFGLNGNWVQFTDRVSDARLAGLVGFLNAHGLPAAAEMAMISDSSACAAGVEGTVPQSDWAAGAARRVHRAGGAIRVMRADDPWSSHLLAGNPCHWTAADVAQRLAATAATVRAVEPDVRIETTEVLSQEITQAELLDFVDAYSIAAGRKLDGFVMDIDYDRPSWGEEALGLEAAIKSRGIRFGVIYHGSLTDADDAAWSATAESRYFEYELVHGGKPDEVLLESWMHLPRAVLPETQPGTFTNLVERYFRPRPALSAAVSGAIVSGKLAGADGAPIAGASIDATVTTTSGAGAPAHYTVSGTVPAGATQAVVGIRVNEECNCNGTADFDVYGASFTLGSDPANLVPDGDFSSGPWFSSGTAAVTLAASDLGAGQMMHVTATPAQMEIVQEGPIAVGAGASYRADFYARIPPATVGSGAFVVIFLGGGGELPRQTVPFAPPAVKASGITDEGGGYAIDLGAPPTNARVDVWYRGDDTRFAAHAGL